mmetsp:Transcript_100661/g.323184  ORF Transcript_100661/g.323184 Transcript_100661/m.323184 type:complete len:560 (-) Transcript_100661:45-1724(-)
MSMGPRRCLTLLFLVGAADALGIHREGAAPARPHLLGGEGGDGGASAAKSPTAVDLDLGSFVAVGSASATRRWGVQLFSVELPKEHGGEVACVNCDISAFAKWVQATFLGIESSELDAASPGTIADGQKHPNAPGYKRWQEQQKAGSKFLQLDAISEERRQPVQAVAVRNLGNLSVKIQGLDPTDVEAMRPQLQRMWSERRLILGPGSDPLNERMGFVEALVFLARGSPALLVDDCGPAMPHCQTLISNGLKPAASAGMLYNALVQSFGPSLLEKHTFNSSWSAEEERVHVQALLSALKGGYRFYRQSCLAPRASPSSSGPMGGGCNPRAASELIGRIACRPEEDGPSDGCVYSELRQCVGGACDASDAGSTAFFEYARLHGPLALFQTRETRSHVMGQCEEFSRAAYAMLASLGFEARYVLDFTDHVWVEVKLQNASGGNTTWVHADPSEGVLDQPLIYEKGWGKNLTMIFAFTPWSVEHVTARYTSDYAATVQRRAVPEDVLQGVLAEAQKRLERELPLRSWGDGAGSLSRDRSFADLALWGHFGDAVALPTAVAAR